jgi:hypothetical protein
LFLSYDDFRVGGEKQMITRILECVVWLLFATCLAGCDDSQDEAIGCCGGTVNQDLTAYEDDVTGLLERTFSGTIEDDDHDVPCRFDGDQFALTIDVAPPSSWECIGSEGQDAECTHAAKAVLPLEGELEMNAVYNLTGQSGLFWNCELSVILVSDLPCHSNNMGDGMLDCLWFDGEIGRFNWGIQPDEEHPEEFEACMLYVDSVD